MKPLPKRPPMNAAETMAVARWYGLKDAFPYDSKLFAHIEVAHAVGEADRWGAILLAKLVQCGALRPGDDPAAALDRVIGGGTKPNKVHWLPNYNGELKTEQLQTACGKNIDVIQSDGTTVPHEITCNTCVKLLRKKQKQKETA